MSLSERLHAIDSFQQRRRPLAFIAAVIKKFGDDQAGQLAALIAYYAFFSLFPLLLVFVTVLGYVLHGDPQAQDNIVHSTLAQFPIIGDEIKRNVHSLHGNGFALAVGIAGALLGGLGVTGASQNAFNRVWHVPFKHRPNWLFARLRGLALLTILGVLSIVSTGVAGFVTASTHGPVAVVGGVLLAFVANLALFGAAFRLMTADKACTRELLPGVLVAAVLWQVLQHIGGYYLTHTLKHAKETYGLFALVIGLLAWLHLGAQVVLFAAEINVVRARHLWPRSLFSPELTTADKRALTSSAEVEERVEEENVEVTFDTDHDGVPDPPEGGPTPAGERPPAAGGTLPDGASR